MEGCGHREAKTSNIEEDVCVFRVFVALQLLGVYVCAWIDPSSVSRKRGEPSKGWTGNSNSANFL